MSPAKGRLIAVDGTSAAAVRRRAKALLTRTDRQLRAGVSLWDASGVFDDLAVAEADAGLPSARTLLLLYAADLVFRLRWEIRPALDDGLTVVAAPYVETALALGRAARIPGGWLTDLFSFAPRASESWIVDGAPRQGRRHAGFVEFSTARLADHGFTGRQLVARTRAHLSAAYRRRHRRHRTSS